MKGDHKYTASALCEWLSDKTNRSFGQTMFLFRLLNKDFDKLKLLEMQIKNCFLHYCPSDMEEVEKVMAMTQRTDLLKL